MKDPQNFLLAFLFLYLMGIVTILGLTTAVRSFYCELTKQPDSVRNAYIYGIVYARQLGIYACFGGLIGVMVSYVWGFPAYYSLIATPVLPLVYSITTTRQKRWRLYFGEMK